jgi:DNA-binding transcriptional LysR family regulator
MARAVQNVFPYCSGPRGCAARAALRRALMRASIEMVVAVEPYTYELQLALVSQNQGFSLVPERI